MVCFGLALKCNEAPYHRCLILSDTKSNDDFVVLVKITTDDGTWPDRVCLLNPGDWSELTDNSTVAYSTAMCGKSKPNLENAIKAGNFTVIKSPSNDILALIAKIGRGYKFTPPLAKEHIMEI